MMKKDIEIPLVTGLYLAIAEEFNDTFQSQDRYVYLINDKDADLEMVLVVSSGADDKKITSTMRHKIERLPAKSYAKIELIQEEVLQLQNVFRVSFFENNRLYEKNFLLEKGAWSDGALRHIKVLGKRGLLLK